MDNMSTNDTTLCTYLNMTLTDLSSPVDRLDALYANITLLENLIITPITRQWQYAKCGQKFYLETTSYRLMNWLKLLPDVILPFVPQVIVPGILALLSACFNISILIVTFRHIKDHIISNWLLAFDALCQLFTMCLFLVNFLAALFSVIVVNFRVCMIASFISTVASFASFMTLYLISLERLFITLAPLRMNIQTSLAKKFSLFAVFTAITFGLAMNNYMLMWQNRSSLQIGVYLYNLGEGNYRLYCNSTLYINKLKTSISYVLLLLAVLNYVLIFVRLLCRYLFGAIMTDADKFINQMMRTLFILSLAIIIGWMLPLITDLSFLFHQYFVLGLFKLFGDSRAGTPLLQQQSALYNSITLFWDSFYSMFIPILASASGAPILFCTSKSYRTAYKSMLKRRTAAGIIPAGDHGDHGRLFIVRRVDTSAGLTTQAQRETQMPNNGTQMSQQ